LTTRSFDTFNTTTTDNIATKATDDVCNTKWSSKDDFVNRVRKWDSNFSYIDIFKGTGNADLSSSGRTVDQDYQQFCEASGRSFLRNFFTNSRTQIASTAVNAWEQCVLATQQVGVFSRAIVAENRTLVTIAIRFVPSGLDNKLILVDYDNSRYSCTLKGKDIKNFNLAAEGLGNSVDIPCSPKDADAELHIAINTNQNQTVGPFVIPSKAYLDLEQKYVALGTRVDALESFLQTNQAALTQTRADINTEFKKLADWGADTPGYRLVFSPSHTDPQKGCAKGSYFASLSPFYADGYDKFDILCKQLPQLELK
jgi:hypothetical protein